MKLELFYDIVSPYSYLALTTLDRYRALWSMELVLRPAFLGGVMKAVGNVPPAIYAAFMAVESKGRFYNDEIRDAYEYARLR